MEKYPKLTPAWKGKELKEDDGSLNWCAFVEFEERVVHVRYAEEALNRGDVPERYEHCERCNRQAIDFLRRHPDATSVTVTLESLG